MSAGFIGLINGLLGCRREVCKPALVQQAKLAAIERYIDRHLHDRQLNPAALARAFGCSRSRLYQLFREHVGVDHYLRERRLGRCFRELAAAEPDNLCGRSPLARRLAAIARCDSSGGKAWNRN